MKKFLYMLTLLPVLLYGCSEEKPKNEVEFDQINVDESNDYRFIFREKIQKEEYLKNKYKKSPFE